MGVLSNSVGEALERFYTTYNHRRFVHPDPLEFLYDYDDPLDREIVGLVASSLAYGRVGQILKSVSSVLSLMPSPRLYLKKATRSSLSKAFFSFKHRFTTGDELSSLLWGIKGVIEKRGSLRKCFEEGLGGEDETLLPALHLFVSVVKREGGIGSYNSLLPSPCKGSACKRLNLFLRWMVRRDRVDPGDWRGVPPEKLFVPLDTHMHRLGLALGLTGRRQADLRTALEITDRFRKISPADPVRFDFALTRLGMKGIEVKDTLSR